jgi:nucleoid DNA-binding protein
MTTPIEAAPVWQPLLPEEELLAEAEMTEATVPSPNAAPQAAGPQRATVSARRPSPARGSGSTTALLVVSALIALGGVGFAVGRATAAGGTTGQSNAAANGGFGGPAAASGNPGDVARNAGVGATTLTGTVVGVAADSITLKLANGQTVQVATTGSTTYHNQASATGTDVTTGSTVTVQTRVGSAASSSAGTNAGASAGTASRTRTATDVTITAK